MWLRFLRARAASSLSLSSHSLCLFYAFLPLFCIFSRSFSTTISACLLSSALCSLVLLLALSFLSPLSLSLFLVISYFAILNASSLIFRWELQRVAKKFSTSRRQNTHTSHPGDCFFQIHMMTQWIQELQQRDAPQSAAPNDLVHREVVSGWTRSEVTGPTTLTSRSHQVPHRWAARELWNGREARRDHATEPTEVAATQRLELDEHDTLHAYWRNTHSEPHTIVAGCGNGSDTWRRVTNRFHP